MKDYKFSNFLLLTIFFFTFLGFYSILLLMFNAGLAGVSRQLTIPMRLVIGICCGLLLVINFRNVSSYLIWFICWVYMYVYRILIDYNGNEYFYLPYSDLVFYFLSFVVIPFISLSSINYAKIDFGRLYSVFLISAIMFTLLSILLYGRYIGQVSRLNASRVGEHVISPLILSYCGALIIGVTSFYLLYVKGNKKKVKYLSFATMALALIPFFLGASRGSIFALLFPFILMTQSKISFSNILKYTILFIILAIVLIYSDEYLGSGLFDRLAGTSRAIEENGSSASRLDIWKKSFSQFVQHPFLGDKLNTQDINHYPHNIFLEVLQSTGIIGFFLFLFLFYSGLKASYNIFKNYEEFAWIPVFFLQAIMQNMFSGAVYTAAWFWASLAIVLSLNMYLKKASYGYS